MKLPLVLNNIYCLRIHFTNRLIHYAKLKIEPVLSLSELVLSLWHVLVDFRGNRAASAMNAELQTKRGTMAPCDSCSCIYCPCESQASRLMFRNINCSVKASTFLSTISFPSSTHATFDQSILEDA
ncbi:hypothetical protein VIGAN_04340600 [Vigna angularis var. angularis]|uniref:Uncharacterized protein n=1 Tax=Vigna angularis var. angularis TaxID=157739 RepID=A0A0S3RZ28_PHAAN|nr:hypothetical protein VIGAN_04340600 [Vigna angularis var. angularis]